MSNKPTIKAKKTSNVPEKKARKKLQLEDLRVEDLEKVTGGLVLVTACDSGLACDSNQGCKA